MLMAPEASPALVDEAPKAQIMEAPEEPISEAPGAQFRRGQGPKAIGEAPPVEEAPVLTAPRAPVMSESAGPDRAAGKSGEAGKQAKFKSELSRSAVENQNALLEVLEEVPESVKPALQRAIEAAGAGYEQALRNLD